MLTTKLLAVYANRISAVLSELLGPMQYAFKGRDVCDWLIFLRDVIDLTQTKKQDAYVLSIDFYKAFDCVDHIFLKSLEMQWFFRYIL